MKQSDIKHTRPLKHSGKITMDNNLNIVQKKNIALY